MTAPHPKIPITVTVIHHAPVHVAPPDTLDHYPINPRWKPDPAIYAEPQAFDCEEMGR